jgi:putative ABC transport system substrate-binding protein
MPVTGRRKLIAALCGAVIVWPVVTRAQPAGKIFRIGFLANDPTIPAQPAGQAFLDGLRENRFVEGKNIVIERRFAEGRLDRYSELLAELLRLNVDVLVTSSNDATLAAKRANTKIPIVMMNVDDPIGQGIVSSLSHPEGNITGVIQDDSPEIAPKRLQLLKDAVPQISTLAVLINPDEAYASAEWKALEQAVRSLNITLQAFEVRRVSEFAAAFDRIKRERPHALFVVTSGLNFTHRGLIMQLAAKSQLPAVSNFREITEAGGLMSYSSVRVDRFRRAAIYVAKILQGAKPADLPIEQPTKYELVINLNTARSLNLEIPRALLLIADDVIE